MSIKIMAIDTATEACSVALWNDGKVTHYNEECPREHTQRILPMVDKILTESNILLTELNVLAFGQGPGSFTGVRIGIGIAQGLALGANLPMVGVSTLKTMAQQALQCNNAKQILAAIDARMGEVYWAAYIQDDQGDLQCLQEECVCSPQQAIQFMSQLSGNWSCVGTGWQAYPQLNEVTNISLQTTNILLPQAEYMLPLALASWNKGEVIAVENAEPVYLRNEVTWKKLPGRE